jgi:hypothetical protein
MSNFIRCLLTQGDHPQSLGILELQCNIQRNDRTKNDVNHHQSTRELRPNLHPWYLCMYRISHIHIITCRWGIEMVRLTVGASKARPACQSGPDP